MGDVIDSTLMHINDLPNLYLYTNEAFFSNFQHIRLLVKKNRFNLGSTLACPPPPQKMLEIFNSLMFISSHP